MNSPGPSYATDLVISGGSRLIDGIFREAVTADRILDFELH